MYKSVVCGNTDVTEIVQIILRSCDCHAISHALPELELSEDAVVAVFESVAGKVWISKHGTGVQKPYKTCKSVNCWNIIITLLCSQRRT